jgi:hypothetical protein
MRTTDGRKWPQINESNDRRRVISGIRDVSVVKKQMSLIFPE